MVAVRFSVMTPLALLIMALGDLIDATAAGAMGLVLLAVLTLLVIERCKDVSLSRSRMCSFRCATPARERASSCLWW